LMAPVMLQLVHLFLADLIFSCFFYSGLHWKGVDSAKQSESVKG
jgi:hypothetical protein